MVGNIVRFPVLVVKMRRLPHGMKSSEEVYPYFLRVRQAFISGWLSLPAVKGRLLRARLLLRERLSQYFRVPTADHVLLWRTAWQAIRVER